MLLLRSVALFSCLSLLGAGCLTVQKSPSVSEPFETKTPPQTVPREQGFGPLPLITWGQSTGRIIPLPNLPELPTKITVLREKRSVPNETELKSLGATLRIPGALIGAHPETRELDFSWESDGFRFHYDAATRHLSFTAIKPITYPLTIRTLPTNAEMIDVANDFLTQYGIRRELYRDGLVEPDWNLWWTLGKSNGLCMDRATLVRIRSIASTDPLISDSLPPLSTANETECSGTEFPNQIAVRYHALVDALDVVGANGRFVNGVEIVVDTLRRTVTAGNITLWGDPDRSDYPALTPQEVSTKLMSGGLSTISGTTTISSYDIRLYEMHDDAGAIPYTYLMPSVVAEGTREYADGHLEATNIVVPLLRQAP